MARSSRTEGIKKFVQQVASRLPAAAKAQLKAANEKSADEFVSTLERILPVGDERRGHIRDTLKKRDGDPEFGGVGVLVSLGDAAHPYPLHLEAGHKAADGSHVPGKPAWNPAKRIVAKKHKARIARAANKAIKIATGGV
jgi:hypothetical protein